jgi:hypothetical protein
MVTVGINFFSPLALFFVNSFYSITSTTGSITGPLLNSLLLYAYLVDFKV